MIMAADQLLSEWIRWEFLTNSGYRGLLMVRVSPVSDRVKVKFKVVCPHGSRLLLGSRVEKEPCHRSAFYSSVPWFWVHVTMPGKVHVPTGTDWVESNARVRVGARWVGCRVVQVRTRLGLAPIGARLG